MARGIKTTLRPLPPVSVDENELLSDEPKEHSMQSPIETPEPASLIPESPPAIFKVSAAALAHLQLGIASIQPWYTPMVCTTKKLMTVFYAFIAYSCREVWSQSLSFLHTLSRKIVRNHQLDA